MNQDAPGAYFIGAINRQLVTDVARTNAQALKLNQIQKPTKEDIGAFISTAIFLTTPSVLIGMEKRQFELLAERLWHPEGKPLSTREKGFLKEQADGFEKSCWEIYNATKSIANATSEGSWLIQGYLTKIDWPEQSAKLDGHD